MTKSESIKNRYKQIVWTDFVQVYTNINYSSLYCEQLREKQQARYFWGIYLCMGIPTVLSILLKMGYFTNAAMVYIICAILLVIPIVLKFKNKKLIYVVLGIYEKEINELLRLNEDLDSYKRKLLDLFFRIEALTDNTTNMEKMILEYEKIKKENERYITQHDLFTGKIDKRLQEQADKMTEIVLCYQQNILYQPVQAVMESMDSN